VQETRQLPYQEREMQVPGEARFSKSDFVLARKIMRRKFPALNNSTLENIPCQRRLWHVRTGYERIY
jgi:hypothetical protein